MTTQTKTKPIVRAPAGACDTHMHVFGPREIYPPATTERYVSPFAPLESSLEEMDEVGIERIVVVQPSAYGLDNSCALDTLKRLGKSGRGIMHLSDAVTDRELQDCMRWGCAASASTPTAIRLRPASPRRLCPDRPRSPSAGAPGWCMNSCARWLTVFLWPVMRRCGRYSLATSAGEGIRSVGQPFFSGSCGAENGRNWLNCPGFTVSGLPDYRGRAVLRALAKVCPARLIWGSAPQLSSPTAPPTRHTMPFTMLALDRRRGERPAVLRRHPAALFGFEVKTRRPARIGITRSANYRTMEPEIAP